MKWINNIKYKNLLIFILVLFGVGLLFGFIYYFSVDNEMKKSISLNIISLKDNLCVNKLNNILLHIGISFSIVVLAFSIIGLPLIFFYLFYEGLSIGFSFTFLISIYGFKGFIFCLLYFIFYKLIYLVLIIYLVLRSVRITKNVVGLLIYHKNKVLKQNLFINIKKVLMVMLFIFIYDVIIYFVSSSINNLLISFL